MQKKKDWRQEVGAFRAFKTTNGIQFTSLDLKFVTLFDCGSEVADQLLAAIRAKKVRVIQ